MATNGKDIPEWLKIDDGLGARVGRPTGSGPTQQLIFKIFDKAAEHGVTALWPSQVYKGAVELFGYRATRDVIKECMKKLVKADFLRASDQGYVLVKRAPPAQPWFKTKPQSFAEAIAKLPPKKT